MEHDFIVGFTLFTRKGFKTMYRHFDKLETAKLFASNKNNCKIYEDLEYFEKEYITKSKVKEIIQKYYDEYEKEKEYRYTLDVEDEQRILKEIEKELL